MILDSDIGDDIDDAYAVQYALNHPSFEIIGITTIFKNVRQRAQMTMKLLELNGRSDIPVYMGYDKPFKEPVNPFIYERKVDKYGLPSLLSFDETLEKYEPKENAVDYIIDTVKAEKGNVVLVALGPMTNIAAAIQKAPEVMSTLKELVVMAGNVDPVREYNIMVDPEAAKIVFESGLNIRAISGKVTLKCWWTMSMLMRQLSNENPAQKYINEMMMTWTSYNMRPPCMHDALTICCILHDFVKYENYDIEILLEPEKRGYSKHYAPSGMRKPILTSVEIDRGAFMEHFFSIMELK